MGSTRTVPHDHPPVHDRRSGELYTFDERGRVPYSLAATVICLRRRAAGTFAPSTLRKAELATDAHGGAWRGGRASERASARASERDSER